MRVRPLRGRLGLLLQIFSISFPVSRALLLPDRHELGLALRVLLDRDLIRATILLIIFLIIYFTLMPDFALLHRCAAIPLLFFHLFENAQVDFASLQEAIDVRAAVEALGFILALSSGQAGVGCTIAAAEVVRDFKLALEICAQVWMCFGEQGLRRLGEICCFCSFLALCGTKLQLLSGLSQLPRQSRLPMPLTLLLGGLLGQSLHPGGLVVDVGLELIHLLDGEVLLALVHQQL